MRDDFCAPASSSYRSSTLIAFQCDEGKWLNRLPRSLSFILLRVATGGVALFSTPDALLRLRVEDVNYHLAEGVEQFNSLDLLRSLLEAIRVFFCNVNSRNVARARTSRALTAATEIPVRCAISTNGSSSRL
jgi:hypothetical protein